MEWELLRNFRRPIGKTLTKYIQYKPMRKFMNESYKYMKSLDNRDKKIYILTQLRHLIRLSLKNLFSAHLRVKHFQVESLRTSEHKG